MWPQPKATSYRLVRQIGQFCFNEKQSQMKFDCDKAVTEWKSKQVLGPEYVRLVQVMVVQYV